MRPNGSVASATSAWPVPVLNQSPAAAAAYLRTVVLPSPGLADHEQCPAAAAQRVTQQAPDLAAMTASRSSMTALICHRPPGHHRLTRTVPLARALTAAAWGRVGVQP